MNQKSIEILVNLLYTVVKVGNMSFSKKKFLVILVISLTILFILLYLVTNCFIFRKNIISNVSNIEKRTTKLKSEYSTINFSGLTCDLNAGYIVNCKIDNKNIYFNNEKIKYCKKNYIKGQFILNDEGEILHAKFKKNIFTKCYNGEKVVSCNKKNKIYGKYKAGDSVLYNPVNLKFCKDDEKNCYNFIVINDSNKYQKELCLILSKNLGNNFSFINGNEIDVFDSLEHITNILKERTHDWKVVPKLITYDEIKKIVSDENDNNITLLIKKNNFLVKNMYNTKGYYTSTDYFLDNEMVYAVTNENKITGVSKKVGNYGLRPVIKISKELK